MSVSGSSDTEVNKLQWTLNKGWYIDIFLSQLSYHLNMPTLKLPTLIQEKSEMHKDFSVLCYLFPLLFWCLTFVFNSKDQSFEILCPILRINISYLIDKNPWFSHLLTLPLTFSKLHVIPLLDLSKLWKKSERVQRFKAGRIKPSQFDSLQQCNYLFTRIIWGTLGYLKEMFLRSKDKVSHLCPCHFFLPTL